MTDEQLKKEMLKKVDKQKIKKLLAMCYNKKDCEIKGLEQLLKEWADKKVSLYKVLGRELKIRKDIDIKKEDIIEMSKVTGRSESNLLDNNSSQFDDFMKRLIDKSPFLATVMYEQFRQADIKRDLPNITRGALCCGTDTRDKYFGKEKEMPFSTLMHKIFLSDEIDIEVSKFLQKISTNVKGCMYISIDPLDYITMSMNRSNWSSCHSLHNFGGDGVHFGQYSAGIFSYMCDDVSTIAYRTNGEQYKYEFNGRSVMLESKNWRQMVFISKDLKYFLTSRQYPFRSEVLTKVIREMVEEKIIKYINADREIKNIPSEWKISRRCNTNKAFIRDSAEDEEYNVLHYNDMLCGYDYEMIYQKRCKKADLENIVIGSNPKCVLCGETRITRASRPGCCFCIGG